MRLAVFQRRPIVDTPDVVVDELLRDLAWADRQGVELALFPECVLLGHAYRKDSVERRSAGVEGPLWRRLLDELQTVSAVSIVGAFERRVDGVITNSAMVVEGGRIVGRYAKAHPNEEGVTAGEAFPVFSVGGIVFGVNICNDANYARAAQEVADRGAKLICYPLWNVMRSEVAQTWRSRSVDNLRARARQTGCWIASADVAGCLDDRVSYGCSVIMNPDGDIVARVPEGDEGVAIVDLL